MKKHRKGIIDVLNLKKTITSEKSLKIYYISGYHAKVNFHVYFSLVNEFQSSKSYVFGCMTHLKILLLKYFSQNIYNMHQISFSFLFNNLLDLVMLYHLKK